MELMDKLKFLRKNRINPEVLFFPMNPQNLNQNLKFRFYLYYILKKKLLLYLYNK